MKIYVKLLSLAAFAMAAMTSCVNEGLQEPQDAEILKTIPTVAEQTAAVETSMKDVQELEEALKSYDVTLDKAVVSAMQEHVAAMAKGASLEEGINAAFALQKKLGAAVGRAIVSLDADTYQTELKSSFDAIEKGVKAWTGKNFESVYPVAVAEAMAIASVNKFDLQINRQKLYVDALKSDVQAGLKNDDKPGELTSLEVSVLETEANSDKLVSELAALAAEVDKEYEAALKSILAEPAGFDSAVLREFNQNVGTELASVDNTLAGLAARVGACEAQLESILARLGALETLVGSVDELLGMIQSVNLMTEYSAEEAVAYYNMDMSAYPTPEGYRVRKPAGTIELKYVVRPASAASALATESLWNNGLKVIGYYANRIQQSAVNDFVNFPITNVTADGLSGVVTVTVENKLSDDFYYKKTGAKMALSVTTGKTDLTTKFVEIVPKDASSTVYLERLTLSKDEVEIDEGDEYSLTPYFTPDNVTNKELVWESDNNNVVFVSGEGRLTGKAVGTATVTVTSKGTDEWGRTLSATCKVKVNPAIRLSGPPYVEVGKTAELILDYPSSMVIDSKLWSVSDASKATVSTAGVVTGVGHTYNTATDDYGTVTVSCIINNSVTVSHEMKVVVTQPTSIKLNNYADNVSEITMKLDQSLDLGATIVPEVPADQFRLYYSAGGQQLGWINTSTGVINEYNNTLTVDNVYVYIEVKNHDKSHYFAPGRSLKRTVIVRVEPYWVKSMTIPETAELSVGMNTTLVPTFVSDVAGRQPTFTELQWTSSNTAVATVDQNGNINAISKGTSIITATTTNPSAVKDSSSPLTATCVLTVKEATVQINVGDYYYSDGTWSSTLNSNKTLLGVVCKVGNPSAVDIKIPSDFIQGYVVSADEISAALSKTTNVYRSHFIDWAVNNGFMNPKENDGYCRWDEAVNELAQGYNNTLAFSGWTDEIANNDYSGYSGWSLYLAGGDLEKFRNSHPVNLAKNTSWYLPSQKEMTFLSGDELKKINSALTAAGKSGIRDTYYWTSSISYSSYVEINPVAKAGKAGPPVTTAQPVRFFLAF